MTLKRSMAGRWQRLAARPWLWLAVVVSAISLATPAVA